MVNDSTPIDTVNFNPRSLTGATPPLVDDVKLAPISIHAPLRERPQFCYWKNKQTLISIHAPLRERLYHSSETCTIIHFNPRSLTGATLNVYVPIYRSLHFNPRSLTGATCRQYSTICLILFQSTLPYGSDRLASVPM